MTPAQPPEHEAAGPSRRRLPAWLSASRPGGYAAVLALVPGSGRRGLPSVGTVSSRARPRGTIRNTYLSYCQATRYGDYDHGAFWFDLEPEAVEGAQARRRAVHREQPDAARVLTPATAAWFSTHGASYYLLGFSHNVNVVFETPLLAKLVRGHGSMC